MHLDSGQTSECVLTFGHKEVEHCDDDSVTAEHVVSTGLDSGQGHAEAAPYCQGSLDLPPAIAVCLRIQKKNTPTVKYLW